MTKKISVSQILLLNVLCWSRQNYEVFWWHANKKSLDYLTPSHWCKCILSASQMSQKDCAWCYAVILLHRWQLLGKSVCHNPIQTIATPEKEAAFLTLWLQTTLPLQHYCIQDANVWTWCRLMSRAKQKPFFETTTQVLRTCIIVKAVLCYTVVWKSS